MKRVELLRAWEGGTWDTEIVDVPDREEDEENGVDFNGACPECEIIDWATKVLLVPGNSRYDGLSMFAVYWIDPEEGDDRSETDLAHERMRDNYAEGP